jgi:hypothetical protein
VTATLPAPAEVLPVVARARFASVVLAGGLVAAWTTLAAVGIVAAFVLLAWLAAGAAQPLPDALAVAVTGLLLGVGATLTADGVAWGVAPLGLTLVVGVLAARAASVAVEWAHVRGRTPVALLVASAAAGAGALGAAAAAAAGSRLSVAVAPGEAAARLGLLVAAGTVVAVLVERRARHGVGPWSRCPDWPSRVATACTGAAAVLLAGAAALTTTALVVAGSGIATLVGQIDPGVAGGLALAAASLAYLPTLVVWVLAVLVGPGVAVGTQVTVTSTGVDAGPLPGFPVLGAVPAAVPGWLGAVGPVLLVGAGVVAGLLLARHRRADDSALRSVGAAGATGAVTGVVAGVACWAASGPMGPGDWVWAGPPVAPVTGIVTLAVALPAALVLLGSQWRDRRAG